MSKSAKQSLQPINYKYLTACKSRLEVKTSAFSTTIKYCELFKALCIGQAKFSLFSSLSFHLTSNRRRHHLAGTTKQNVEFKLFTQSEPLSNTSSETCFSLTRCIPNVEFTQLSCTFRPRQKKSRVLFVCLLLFASSKFLGRRLLSQMSQQY